MDSNASNNIYFKPSYRTTQQGEQQGLSSAKQSLRELPQPNSNPKCSCVSVINGEAEPWNSYSRSEPQECRGSGKWRGLPKHRLQESRKFPGSHHQDAQLPVSAVCTATDPQPHCPLQTCCKMPPRGWQRWSAHWAGAQTQLKAHWSSSQACRDVFWSCSLGITKMRLAEQEALVFAKCWTHTLMPLRISFSHLHIKGKKLK